MQITLLCVAVFLSRLPFIDAGYGVNVDAWRVARTAQEIAATGQYSVSRFPGYPVQEIVCSIFWRGGPRALNALSAFLSAVAVVPLPFSRAGSDVAPGFGQRSPWRQHPSSS